jgi:hypothetical protein
MSLQRYRAVRRKLRGKPQSHRNAELVRIIKSGDEANREAYARLRQSGLNEHIAEAILDARHVGRRLESSTAQG